MKRLILFVLVSIVINCATMQSIPIEDRSRILNASYDITFGTTAAFFNEKGFTLKTIDKESGLIDTDYQGGSAWAAVFSGTNYRTKINAFFRREDQNRTKLTLTISTEQKQAFGGWQASTFTTGQALKTYNEYFDEIIKRANSDMSNQQNTNMVQPKEQNEDIMALFEEPKKETVLIEIQKIVQNYVLVINDQNLIFQTGKQFELIRDDKAIGIAEVLRVDGEKIAFKIILDHKNNSIKITDKIQYIK